VPRIRSAFLLLAFFAAALAGCGAGTIPAVRSEPERLDLARRLAAQGHCSVSIELLKTYIAVNTGSGDVDEAICQLGECYLKMKDWVAASAEFERLLRDYPESDSGAAASFRLGEALFGQARPPDFDQDYTTRALAQWQSYLRTYPGHWLNPEAERRVAMTRKRLGTKLLHTGRLYLKLKLSEPARVYFQRVEQEYGDTDLLGEALLGLALSDVLAGRRAEAVEKLTRIESQFAGRPIAQRAADERKRLGH